MNPMAGVDQRYRGQPAPEVDPGSMGQMDANYGAYGGTGYDNDSFDEEQPLLQELGINAELIKQKVRCLYLIVWLVFLFSLCTRLYLFSIHFKRPMLQ